MGDIFVTDILIDIKKSLIEIKELLKKEGTETVSRDTFTCNGCDQHFVRYNATYTPKFCDRCLKIIKSYKVKVG
jgi:hypothetical protein